MRSSSPLHRFATVVAAGTLLLSACSDPAPKSEGGGSKKKTTTTVAKASAAADKSGNWTVLVYMDADNNLEEAALDDLMEMTEAKGTDFVVLVDRSPGYTDADVFGLGDFDDTRVLHIKDGDVEVVAEPGELNMGDPEVLASFIAEGVKSYPNDHHALTLWNHGGGWKGIAWDDSSDHDHLEISDVASAVEAGLEDTDLERFDLIGFDACLMATYEVGDLLAPVGTYMLASEDLEPGHGWDWSTMSTKGGATTKELAKSVIEGFTAFAKQNGENATTLSLVDLRALEALDDAVAQLAKSMSKGAAKAVGRIGYSRSESLGFARDPNPEYDYFLVDMGDLAKAFEDVPGMEKAAKAVRDAVDQVVALTDNGPAAAAATGITAHFPPTAELASDEYRSLGATSGWTDFLDAYYEAVGDVDEDDLPMFVDEDRYIEEDAAVTTVDGVDIRADVTKGTGGNLADARLHWGEVDIDDTDWVVWFGERNAEVKRDTVSADYDWRYLTMTDGTNESVAYAKLTVDGKGNITRIAVPLAFHTGGNTYPGSLYLTMAEGKKITAETLYVRVDDGLAAVRPRPGDTFTPMLKRQHLTDMAVDWVKATTTPLDARGGARNYRFGTLPAATAIMVGLNITDIAGNQDSVYHGTATPAELDGE